MKDAVVIGGLGMVGQATRYAFGIDKYIDTKGSTSSYKEAGESRYIFLCLPTPTINGVCDTDSIKESIKSVLDQSVKQNVFIIRSTVVPGTSKALMESLGINSIVHNPEFLSEKTWKEDSDHPGMIVLGGEHSSYLEDVESVFKGRYKGVDIIKTDTVTSETVKYGFNAFYAMKVVYANMLYDQCQRSGANYERLKEIMYKNPWVGSNHLDIWHKGGRGAGGKCLKKDLEAFAVYTNSKLLKTVQDLNEQLLSKYPKTE